MPRVGSAPRVCHEVTCMQLKIDRLIQRHQGGPGDRPQASLIFHKQSHSQYTASLVHSPLVQ